MVVGMGGVCDLGKSMVLACDSMLSASEVSGDRAAHKMFPLSAHFQWWAMFAGDSIGQIPIVADAMVHSLFRLSDSTNTADAVARCVLEAFRVVRLRHAVDLVLSPIGFTLDRFLAQSDRHPDLK